MSNVYGPSLTDFVCLPTNTMQANFCRMFFSVCVCVCERERERERVGSLCIQYMSHSTVFLVWYNLLVFLAKIVRKMHACAHTPTRTHTFLCILIVATLFYNGCILIEPWTGSSLAAENELDVNRSVSFNAHVSWHFGSCVKLLGAHAADAGCGQCKASL